MSKLRIKISGCTRSMAGAEEYSDLLWIRLTGPTQIEIVARTLTTG